MRHMDRGEIDKLKANYRRPLARDGYALVKCEEAVVSAIIPRDRWPAPQRDATL